MTEKGNYMLSTSHNHKHVFKLGSKTKSRLVLFYMVKEKKYTKLNIRYALYNT